MIVVRFLLWWRSITPTAKPYFQKYLLCDPEAEILQ
jgi:hypothetical protein